MDNCIDNYFSEVYYPWMMASNKAEIEDKYRGPHEFKPQYRGDCYTAEFTGDHPKVIQDNMHLLKQKIQYQLGLLDV